MKLHGLIRPHTRDRIVERDDTRLPAAWVWSARANQNTSALHWLTQSTPAPFRTDRNAPVLVMLNGTHDDAAFKELLAHAAIGSRMYVIVPERWGAKDVDSELLYAPKVLIRRVPEVPTSAVHTATGARIWLGGPWHLRLDDKQSSSLRNVFLRLFWHEAIEEAWTGGKQLLWRVAAERPFDVPEASRNAPIRFAQDVRLGTNILGALVHSTSDMPPEEQPRRLWLRPGPEHHDRLENWVRHGAHIVWEDRGLPDMVVNGLGGELLLAGKHKRMRVVLNAEQSMDAMKLLEMPSQWTFGVDLRIGEPALQSSSFWLRGEKQARQLEKQQPIKLSDVPATSLRSVEETLPPKFDEPQPLALSVLYQWTVVPPRIPAGSSEDPLIGKWRKLDEEWQSSIVSVRQTLTQVEDKQGSVASKLLSRLKGAFLGFGRTRQELLDQLTNMQQQTPSVVGPSGTRDMLSELAKVTERARQLQGDVDEAERKAQEDDAREQQEREHRARVEEAEREVPKKKSELSDAETLLANLETEKAEVDEAKKTADKDALKDLEARQKKVFDEIKSANKTVARIRGELRDAEQRAEEKFDFRLPPNLAVRPKQANAGKFVPTTSHARPEDKVPDDALPEVGALRVHKNQRYLMIQTWEELAQGEQTAERLNAMLVAPENV